eukprot:TRINITY_DN4536_c0_g1_i1.p1 TRINITY_DN4536_c0_g1~~TRINITY_DN4536_c0_g1_i1.p1  ORF type:complete len:239 (-),score=71.58 TRINITY_DN4536_c0_g1_i1:21-737(-)
MERDWKEDRSVLLTTHSMEEAEACSSRVGMMVYGQFTCIGGIQHLKARFQSQHFIFLNCLKEKAHEVDLFMARNFPDSKKIQGENGVGVHYNTGKMKSIATSFELMEGNKESLGILSYTITQATLEQVFVHFAQEDEEDLPPDYWPLEPKVHQCKKCKRGVTTTIEKKITGFAITLACIAFLLCPIMFPVPLLVPITKDIVHRCPRCKNIMGVNKVSAMVFRRRMLALMFGSKTEGRK